MVTVSESGNRQLQKVKNNSEMIIHHIANHLGGFVSKRPNDAGFGYQIHFNKSILNRFKVPVVTIYWYYNSISIRINKYYYDDRILEITNLYSDGIPVNIVLD